MLGKTRKSDISQTGLKYPCSPHPAKNQLAKEGPDSVAPVDLILDKSLNSDRSLYLVRALRYLDRT